MGAYSRMDDEVLLSCFANALCRCWSLVTLRLSKPTTDVLKAVTNSSGMVTKKLEVFVN